MRPRHGNARAAGKPQPGRRDVRARVAAAVAFGVLALGMTLYAWNGDTALDGPSTPRADPRTDAMAHARERQREEFDARFQQAVMMLHARQYEHAVAALHRLLEMDPAVPEVHANMGFALLGLQRYAAAKDFFEGATALRAQQVNAYYGLGVALEALGDRPGALGAMRTYVHLASPEDRWLPKARAALWEWQAQSLH